MPIRSRFIPTIEHHVILDRITICYSDPHPENVRDTCGLLLSERYTRDISGLRIRPNARYQVSATIPVPFMTESAIGIQSVSRQALAVKGALLIVSILIPHSSH